MRNYNIYLLAKLLNEELNSKDLKFYNKILKSFHKAYSKILALYSMHFYKFD